MDDLISRQAAIDALCRECSGNCIPCDSFPCGEVEAIQKLPSADAVEVVKCQDCKHQEKYFHADGRMKGGGRFIYGCDLAEEYSHVCLDDDFCSRGERKDE